MELEGFTAFSSTQYKMPLTKALIVQPKQLLIGFATASFFACIVTTLINHPTRVLNECY